MRLSEGTNLSYDYVEQLLKNYYKNEYGQGANFDLSIRSYKRPGGGWDSDEYHTYYYMEGKVSYTQTTSAFGKRVSFTDYEIIEKEELEEVLKEILNEKLAAEGNNLGVSWVRAEEEDVYVSLNNKKLIKKRF